MSEMPFAAALDWLRAKVDGAPDAAASPSLPESFTSLAERFGLTRFEQDVLLLCAATELDPEMAGRYQRLHGFPYPTFALAFRLFDRFDWEALSPHRPLRYWRMIEINQPGAVPLTAAALRADERIVGFLAGVNVLDDRLQWLTTSVAAAGDEALSPSQRQAADRLAAAWTDRPALIVQLAGADAATIHTAAAHAARLLGRDLRRMPAAWLPSDPAELDQIARLWARESRMLPLALVVDAHDATTTAAERPGAIERLCAHDLGVVAIATREPRAELGPAIDIERPTRLEQYQAWTHALGSDRELTSQRLSAQFNLSLPAIGDLAQPGKTDGETWRACLEFTRPRLDQLATRIEARANWRDLVLPPTERQLLYSVVRHAAQRYVVYDEWGFRRKTSRGLGIAALFAGDSGTGKTLAAEVLARHLALNLYRIDLSAVVSKYIGETEKNLRRVFDAAEDGGAILFFDEADALFGKRTEVKDSHDRYANIEINYLLQRIESFGGLTILSTNLKSAIDHAFLRRIRFYVNFPFPDAAARRRIWEKAIPREAPVERNHPRLRVDFAALSRLNLTGGSIHNIAVNSAFAAARRGRRITWPIVLEAARAELRKLDRPISEIDRGLAIRREVAHA
jgi:hypothetical protein